MQGVRRSSSIGNILCSIVLSIVLVTYAVTAVPDERARFSTSNEPVDPSSAGKHGESTEAGHVMQFFQLDLVDSVFFPVNCNVALEKMFREQKVGSLFGYYYADSQGRFIPLDANIQYTYNQSGIAVVWDFMTNSQTVLQANDPIFKWLVDRYYKSTEAVPRVPLVDMQTEFGLRFGYEGYSVYHHHSPDITIEWKADDHLPETSAVEYTVFDTILQIANITMGSLLDIPEVYRRDNLMKHWIASIAADFMSILDNYPIRLLTEYSDPSRFHYRVQRVMTPIVATKITRKALIDTIELTARFPTEEVREEYIQYVQRLWKLGADIRTSLHNDPFKQLPIVLNTTFTTSKASDAGILSTFPGQTGMLHTELRLDTDAFRRVEKTIPIPYFMRWNFTQGTTFAGTGNDLIPWEWQSVTPMPTLIPLTYDNPHYDSYSLSPAGHAFTEDTQACYDTRTAPAPTVGVHLKDYVFWYNQTSVTVANDTDVTPHHAPTTHNTCIMGGTVWMSTEMRHSMPAAKGDDPQVLTITIPNTIIVLHDTTRPGLSSWVIPVAVTVTVAGSAAALLGLCHTVGWAIFRVVVAVMKARKVEVVGEDEEPLIIDSQRSVGLLSPSVCEAE